MIIIDSNEVLNRFRFPNGFISWSETHHLVVEKITAELLEIPIRSQVLAEIQEKEGICGHWEFARKITTEFETANKGVEWGVDDNDFFEAVDQFLQIKLYPEGGQP